MADEATGNVTANVEHAAADGASANAPENDPERTCPWCGAHAAPGATTCPGCGAALAARDSLGGLVIPGVTSVDPALQALENEPLHLVRPSSAQGLAGGTLAAAALGGPAGLAALGGLAAVAAVEYASSGSPFGEAVPLDQLGEPSEAAREMARRLEQTDATTPSGDGEVGAETPESESAEAPAIALDPWRDVPDRQVGHLPDIERFGGPR